VSPYHGVVDPGINFGPCHIAVG